jgi:hypothetical protein
LRGPNEAATVLLSYLHEAQYFESIKVQTPRGTDQTSLASSNAVPANGASDPGYSLLQNISNVWNGFKGSPSTQESNGGALSASASLGAVKKVTIQPTPAKKPKVEGPLAQYVSVASVAKDTKDNCAICTFCLSGGGMYDVNDDNLSWLMLNGCKHTFHATCLEEMMKQSNDFVQCPHCKAIYGTKKGTQPTTITMSHYIEQSSLPGFHKTSTIVIRYDGTPGIQGPEHPKPGV